MKSFRKILLLGSVALTFVNCNEFLDVNNNPNGPQKVSANLYLAPMLHWMVTSPQLDGRFTGRYTQQFVLTSTVLTTWDRMGYDPSSDNGAQQWRDVYWTFGQNLVDMTILAEAEERWQLGANVTPDDIELLDGHVGLGYARSRPEELATIRDLCHSDGVVLDPVYTGKAFHGLVTELRKDPKRFGSTVAFIHTGGMFGLFASSETIAQVL